VRSLGFTVESGQCVGIIGANGAGKTSTLKALMGQAPRTGCTARHRLRTRRTTRLLRPTVEQNLLLGAVTRRWDTTTRARLREQYELFPVLGEMKDRPAGALSGGQQQMLAIGRALMSKPRLLLLDEPSMGLSPKLVGEILTVLRRLREEEGLSMVLVEQNAALTFGVADHCLVMENGEVAMEGPSARLGNDPQVRRVYLGL
jgi:branched-chain amino acid transport system ATP-binding protein